MRKCLQKMNGLFWCIFLLLAVAVIGLASPVNQLTNKQIYFLGEKLKIELKKHDKFSQELETLSSLENCRNSIDPVDCIKEQESYQNVKDRLSTAITKNLLYTRRKLKLKQTETQSVFVGNLTDKEFQRK